MNKEKYNSIELSILTFILLNSFTSTIIINSFKGYNTLEVLISLSTSLLIGLPLIFFIIRLYNNNLLNNLNKILLLIFIICSSIIGIYSLSYNTKIINDIIIPNHNILVITLSITIISSFLANKGLKSITIASNLFFIILSIVFIITVIFNIENVETINLLPIKTNIYKLNFIEPLIYSITPILFLLVIPKENIINYEKYIKSIKKSCIVFYIYLIIKILFIISILGVKYMNILQYPEIYIFKSINILNIFERIEEFLTINIFIENFILLSLSFYYTKTLLDKLINYKYNLLIISTIIFLITININILNNNTLLISNSLFLILNIFSYKRKNR